MMLTRVKIAGLLEVKNCPHGRGVFATRDFGTGELIRSYENISITTTPKSPPWKRWALVIGRTPNGEPIFWDEASEAGGEYWSNFLDHSDRPNVRFLIDIKDRTARLVTIGPLRAGEEMLLNYKEYDADNWAPSEVL